jgi:hypothetical protein
MASFQCKSIECQNLDTISIRRVGMRTWSINDANAKTSLLGVGLEISVDMRSSGAIKRAFPPAEPAEEVPDIEIISST